MQKKVFVQGLILVAVLIVPLLLNYMGHPFYLDLATRLCILAIAAVGLNLILGYGGMISFGHAAYLGLGAYAVGIPAHHWLYGGMDAFATTNGFVQFGLALLVSGIFALLTGLICLKVKGVYFIMITMAFAQMVYYLFISIAEYGGDDGLVIDTRSEFPLVNFDDSTQLFTICAVSLFFVMWLVWRISKSQFGMVLAGIKGNEQRMIAMGYNTFAYKLAAYVISGMICGFSGALLGNFTTFISPEMIDWARSGELMFMVILGGVATTFGPLLGAITFIILEEVLSTMTIYWHLPFGLLLIGVVMFVKGGLSALIPKAGDKE
jgi:branched-chain amino acid transport system permease protein